MKQTIRTLIVDDERYSRDELSFLLESYPLIEVVGQAESGQEALVKALKLKPDLVFLDVEMPEMNGMDAAASLLEIKKAPLLVFATAYPQFAAEAFRYEALDYLLKPYDEKQLNVTIERVQKRLSFVPSTNDDRPKGKLSIETEGDIVFLEPTDLLYVYRDDNSVKLVSSTNIYNTRTTLKEWEERLQMYAFSRIHKSYLVNMAKVKKLTPWLNGAYELEVEGQKEKLPVSRNYVKALRERLEL